ncbi:MAG: preprotein translocase subunit SecA [Candidatus Omnitrophica bacterium]|nr:preprotein translocase subunit SecA [Candidatus Omnitrophota bacterium]
MIKKIIFNNSQKKINSLKPEVNIVLNKEIPTPSLKEITILSKIVSKVNSFEAQLLEKPDSFFKEKTIEYKKIIQDKTSTLSDEDYRAGVDKVLDEILPFYFAMVREAGRRTIKMRHFDVQILGGIVLHKNRIAEMVTGEGKTLVATLSASLNALTAKGVHVITVNDYLAGRDRDWMSPIYEFLGLTCGVIKQDTDKANRRAAYHCDITYGTNNEFGFDYLRDNMVNHHREMVQRNYFYAIVDEVDSILVDEARTPLIISGPAEVSIDKYYHADKAVRQLKTKFVIQSFDGKDGMVTIKNKDGSEVRLQPEELEENYDAIVEEKTRNAYLTPRGERKCESALGIKSIAEDTPDKFSNTWIHYVTQALKAHNFFKCDCEYIAKDGRVVIVDEFTGRLMPGRRWSDGLHQAVEAKEGLKIQQESQTLATVTLQNYFRMYQKLAGMTGTAYTEANEFRHIYNLDVSVTPTNRPLARENFADRIYKTKRGKFDAVIAEIEHSYEKKQPVLVGTTSIEDSETLSFLLSKKGVPHSVLNAKHHQREAQIVAQAGRLGQITIATNMAGRGTDIVLGGNVEAFVKDLLGKGDLSEDDQDYKEEYSKLIKEYADKFSKEQKKVIEVGGLHVIGTQRHEARRIDNQLRGRSGRQGDPGSSRFYVSLEDDLMRLFGSDRIYILMDRFGFPEDEPIEHALINKSLEIAQKRVERHNFEIRKHLLEYDNVMNKQREVIYYQRKQVLSKENIREEILDMVDEVIDKDVPIYFQEEKNLLGLKNWLKQKFDADIATNEFNDSEIEEVVSSLKTTVSRILEDRSREAGQEEFFHMEKAVALWTIDSRWKEHLLIMDSLKEGIYLRGYANTEPLIEYQKESYGAFEEMIDSIKEGIVDMVFKAKITRKETSVFDEGAKNFVHSQYSPLKKKGAVAQENSKEISAKKVEQKVGRNEPCPCGSGKKYKKCCGK